MIREERLDRLCARLFSCSPLFIPLPIALPDDQMSPFQAPVPLPNPEPNALLAGRGCSTLEVPVPNPNGPSRLFLVCCGKRQLRGSVAKLGRTLSDLPLRSLSGFSTGLNLVCAAPVRGSAKDRYSCRGNAHAFVTDSHFIQARQVYMKGEYN